MFGFSSVQLPLKLCYEIDLTVSAFHEGMCITVNKLAIALIFQQIFVCVCQLLEPSIAIHLLCLYVYLNFYSVCLRGSLYINI